MMASVGWELQPEDPERSEMVWMRGQRCVVMARASSHSAVESE